MRLVEYARAHRLGEPVRGAVLDDDAAAVEARQDVPHHGPADREMLAERGFRELIGAEGDAVQRVLLHRLEDALPARLDEVAGDVGGKVEVDEVQVDALQLALRAAADDVALRSARPNATLLFEQLQRPLDRRAADAEPIGDGRRQEACSRCQPPALDVGREDVPNDFVVGLVDCQDRSRMLRRVDAPAPTQLTCIALPFSALKQPSPAYRQRRQGQGDLTSADSYRRRSQATDTNERRF